MSDPWITIAPVFPPRHAPEGMTFPYYFDKRVSYRLIPDWVMDDTTVDDLRAKLREQIAEGSTHCLAVEYQADAFGDPDPNWKGPPPRSIQAAASESVAFVTLAFWLANPVSLQVARIAHAANHGSEWVIRSIEEGPPHLALEEHAWKRATVEDFAKARALFQVLGAPSIQGTIRTAAQVTSRALTERSWILRFLLLWLGVECLFGPEDARGEITFQLSQRAALFLEKDPARAKELFAKLKASYAWRSKIVHGLRLSKLNEEKSYALLVELQAIVRCALTAVLDSEAVAATFDGTEREAYLDGLAFE